MLAVDLGFNEEFIEFVEETEKKFNNLGLSFSFKEMLKENMDVLKSEKIFKELSEREMFMYVLSIIQQMVMDVQK